MKVTVVPKDFVHHVWPSVASMIDDILEYDTVGRYHPSDAFLACSEGKAQLWLIYEDPKEMPLGIAVTRVLEYPRKKMLFIDGVAGKNFEACIPALLDTLVSFAKGAGCAGVEGYSRIGWKRVMAKYGVASPRTTLELAFDEGESAEEHDQ